MNIIFCWYWNCFFRTYFIYTNIYYIIFIYLYIYLHIYLFYIYNSIYVYICYTCILYMVLYMVFFTEGLRSSYRKLAWVGFEPATTEFRSDALTDWTIRSWVQLALRANFVQVLQFHLFFQCSRFISVFVFVSHHICIKRTLAQVVTLVAEWIDTYVFTTEGFLEVVIESWLEWDLNPRPLNSVQTL